MISINIEKELVHQEGILNLKINTILHSDGFFGIFGKSGAGKTMLLRMLAGLTMPDYGIIEVDGEVWFDKEKNINYPIQKRQIGLVFQEYNLFPNMNVIDNIRFASGKNFKPRFINELIELAELGNLKDRMPDTLSGGQKQRVAIVRAMASKPRFLFLDEPFSALEVSMRYKLQDIIKKIYDQFKVTTFLISHDVSELIRLSNEVMVIKYGKIVKQGKSQDVLIKKRISGKCTFPGQILSLEKADTVWVSAIRVLNTISRVVVTEDEAKKLSPGDNVLVAAKAFNPVLIKSIDT